MSGPSLLAIPPLLQHFVLTLVFSFVIGLELHSYRRANKPNLGFGTTRTFTLIGAMGFVLYVLDPSGLLYTAGLLVLAGFLWAYYWRRSGEAQLSLLSPLLAVLTYLIGPLATGFPTWFLVLFVVVVLLMLGEKPGIRRLSDALRTEEMVTVAKFLIMAGIVLPLLPDRQIAPMIGVTYYQVWLAVIAVSAISYLGYLGQTYLFKNRGLLMTGVLGGLYSSTAATLVIARQGRGDVDQRQVSPALVLATAMMYIRLLVLVGVLGHGQALVTLLGPFLVFVAASGLAAYLYYRLQPHHAANPRPIVIKHPLEFGVALVFAVLFLVFAAATQFVLARFGAGGLHVLSFVSGLTDIDPFILSLLAGKFHITAAQVTGAIIIAAGSNNLLKAGYAMALGRSRIILPAAVWLIFLFLASLGYAYVVL